MLSVFGMGHDSSCFVCILPLPWNAFPYPLCLANSYLPIRSHLDTTFFMKPTPISPSLGEMSLYCTLVAALIMESCDKKWRAYISYGGQGMPSEEGTFELKPEK